jgi:hypothetical protein
VEVEQAAGGEPGEAGEPEEPGFITLMEQQLEQIMAETRAYAAELPASPAPPTVPLAAAGVDGDHGCEPPAAPSTMPSVPVVAAEDSAQEHPEGTAAAEPEAEPAVLPEPVTMATPDPAAPGDVQEIVREEDADDSAAGSTPQPTPGEALVCFQPARSVPATATACW